MARPIFVYRLHELDKLRVLNNTENWSLRIDRPEYRVWLSHDGTEIRVDEKQPDNGPWKEAERYPAR